MASTAGHVIGRACFRCTAALQPRAQATGASFKLTGVSGSAGPAKIPAPGRLEIKHRAQKLSQPPMFACLHKYVALWCRIKLLLYEIQASRKLSKYVQSLNTSLNLACHHNLPPVATVCRTRVQPGFGIQAAVS